VYEHALAWVERLVPAPGVLVDVGCGAGILLALCQARGWKGIGFDPSVQAVGYAQARGLEVHAGTFPPCPLADGTADALTFINVLDHLRDPFAALREARRVLRVGGVLYIRVPNGPFHVRLLPLLSAIGLGDLTVFHLYGFGRSAFRHHLPDLGFEIVVLQTAPPSQNDPYGGSGGSGEGVRTVLKWIGRAGFHLLQSLALIGKAWGPSIEVVARKRSSDTQSLDGRGQG
jgi:SAM-dependent methyltransferase